MSEIKRNQDIGSGQQGNQNWDDQNDQRTSGDRKPNPERYENEDDSTEKTRSGSGFNERSTEGAGSSQRGEKDNAGPLDSDLSDLPSEKRSGGNLSGPGLG